MPEGTEIGAVEDQQSVPKNPVYGLAIGFGREGTVAGAGRTVGSAISTLAERETRSTGAAARAEAATAEWTSARLRGGLEGEPSSDSVLGPGGRAAESWRVPPSGTGGDDDGARAQTCSGSGGGIGDRRW